MSFNIAHTYEQGSKGYDTWLQDIVAVIKDNDFDIVLLQEVPIGLDKRYDTKIFKTAKEKNILDDFTTLLGKNWSYYSTANYAIRSNITMGEENYVYCDANQNNAILYNGYKVLAKDMATELGFAEFKGNFLFDKNTVQVLEFRISGKETEKFIVINVHLPYTNYEHRMRDLKTLEKLYTKYKLSMGVLIGGDFNLYRGDLTKRNFDFVDGNNSWYYDKNFGLKTTFSTDKDSIKFVSDYDHFVYNEKIKIKENMSRVSIKTKDDSVQSIKLGKKTYNSSKDIRKYISDHVPIGITINF